MTMRGMNLWPKRDSMIAPRPPRDGREWDVQCARCGSSTSREDCYECGGEGWVEVDYGDGIVPDIDDVPCPACQGSGGFESCLSNEDWCEGHPIAGREHVARGRLEWFVTHDPDRAPDAQAKPKAGAP